MRGNSSRGLVSGDGHHAVVAGKAQACAVPGESLVLAGTSLANSLFLGALTPSRTWSNQHTVQNVLQTLPSLSLCHTHFGEKKPRLLLSHRNVCNYYLHGRSNFVKCGVNRETGEALVLHQRAQSLRR